jgi:uncharacterized protein (TIGR02996 family)
VKPMIEAFESSLRDNPDDLAGWSAYADWLTEQGDPRGEFMAVQIALERETTPARERKRLEQREAQLLEDQERWLGAELAEAIRETRPPHQEAVQLTFRRGWLQAITLDLFDYYTDRSPQERLLEAIVAAPATRWVLSLTVRPPDRTDLGALARAPFMPVLRRLHIGGDEENSYSDQTYGDELIIDNAPQLESVVLCMKEPPQEALFRAKLPNLREIVVGCAWDFSTKQLAANSSFRNVRVLRLVPSCLHPEGHDAAILRLDDLRHIANSPHLVSLAELRFSLSDIGDEGIEELIRSGLLHRLEVLDLSFGTVTDAGAAAIVRALTDRPHRLRVLNLRGNALTASGKSALKSLSGLELITSEQHEPDNRDFLFENGNME